MHQRTNIQLSAGDRKKLKSVIANRNSPQKHVWRAKICASDGRWSWHCRNHHPRFVFHFTPTSASWLNAVESFFAKLTKKRLKSDVFRSLQELKDAIHRFLDDTNANPKPYTWTKDPNKIIAAVKRGHQTLNSIH